MHFKSMEDSVNLKKSLSTPPLIENKLEDCIVTNKIEKVQMETSLNAILNKKIDMIDSNNMVDEKLKMCEKSCNICRIF